MKNSIKTLGAFVLILFALFACKKEDDKIIIDEKEQLYSLSIQVGTQRGKTENAILVGTEKELKDALKNAGEPVALKKVSTHNNVFVPVVGPVKPTMDLCWEEIENYYQAHIQSWLQIANENCHPVRVCLTCPNAGAGLFVLYEIKPTSPKCLALEAQFELSKFNFSDTEYDTEAVAQYITSK